MHDPVRREAIYWLIVIASILAIALILTIRYCLPL